MRLRLLLRSHRTLGTALLEQLLLLLLLELLLLLSMLLWSRTTGPIVFVLRHCPGPLSLLVLIMSLRMMTMLLSSSLIIEDILLVFLSCC